MALNDAFGAAGFDLYREWAQRSIKFDEKEIRKKWRSFTPGGGITIATLFGHGAQQRLETQARIEEEDDGQRQRAARARRQRGSGADRQDIDGRGRPRRSC